MIKMFVNLLLFIFLAETSLLKRGEQYEAAKINQVDKSSSTLRGFESLYNQQWVSRMLESSKQPIKKPYKVEEIPPKVKSNAKRVRIIYGPYVIKGSESKIKYPGNTASMDPDGSSYVETVGQEFPRNALIIDQISHPINESMMTINMEDGFYNHHAVIMNYNKREKNWLFCNRTSVPDLTPWSIIIGSGNGGVYVGANDLLVLSVDLINYNKEDRTVYVYNELEYLHGLPQGYSSGEQRQIPMGACDGDFALKGLTSTTIHPPAEKKKFFLTGEKDLDIGLDGFLTSTYAHLHDGGTHMVFTLNGEEVCNSTVVYGGPGFERRQADGIVWKSMAKTFSCPNPIRVHKGDKLQMSAFFDFDTHQPRRSVHGHEAEAMALAGVIFMPYVPGMEDEVTG